MVLLVIKTQFKRKDTQNHSNHLPGHISNSEQSIDAWNPNHFLCEKKENIERESSRDFQLNV